MKKYLRYADVFVLFSGALGLLLRLMVMLGGTDEKELYPARHPAWIIACVLAVLVVAAIWLLTRKVGMDNRYEVNFPRSVPGAVGCGLGAVGVLVTAISIPDSKMLSLLVCVSGLLAAGGLGLAAYSRFMGKKPQFACFALCCVFFTLRVFLLGQTLGAEPESYRYLFEMLAALAVIPASYQLWGFTVDLGDRQKCLFWCLTAGFLSMVALINPDSWLLHLTMTAWLLTNLCPLKELRKQVRQPEAEPEQPDQMPEQAEEEQPEEAVPQDQPAPETAPAEIEPIDVDAILAEIMKEIDKNVE